MEPRESLSIPGVKDLARLQAADGADEGRAAQHVQRDRPEAAAVRREGQVGRSTTPAAGGHGSLLIRQNPMKGGHAGMVRRS